ncbi:kynureninase [Didymella exigua CBS 183.55]|uniref:Kynureninase n=1 Tax=Didymella exigua CBS 183.55 TaxID=1150837 RepID=A0A6A5RZM3_9PLEO|nr:kynureninase [Didymella exigua CBS 183.55]KAF1932684.1 kynureninase [Didymella exigua CBS 183.55]
MPGPGNPYLAIADAELCSEAFARREDEKDELSALRKEFVIPTKGDLRNKKYGFQQQADATRNGDDDNDDDDDDNDDNDDNDNDNEEAIYFCGNSLGLQPRRTRDYVNRCLETWASKGVFGHFTDYEDGLPPWLHLDDATKAQSASIVGALPSEVAVMQTLTANLHLLMSSFYRPTADRWKIIIEGKAFPSDHYAALSQIAHHNLPPSSLVTISPPSDASPYLSTEHILSVISQHAATTALVLLPGIQFYSGQFLDMELITRHCHSNGIPIGWDLAHAVGNVELKLHEWNVDFAAWCNYKYMNGGPGVIGGLFVHEMHGRVDPAPTAPSGTSTSSTAAGTSTAASTAPASTPASTTPASTTPASTAAPNPAPPSATQLTYRPRLSGWWGSDKTSRFAMDNSFVPIPGASGFQLSNPSALDMASVLASLAVFSQTSMSALRARSERLTGYLEARLLRYPAPSSGATQPKPPYSIITPSRPCERGAQLSVRLAPGLLDGVQAALSARGVVVDERKPDVLRVAPAPLYNSFMDVHRFVAVFHDACRRALASGQTARAETRRRAGVAKT